MGLTLRYPDSAPFGGWTISRTAILSAVVVVPLVSGPPAADVFSINAATASASSRHSYDVFSDVWALDVNDFAASGPLVFANAAAGDPGVLGTGLGNTSTFASDANVIVLQNYDCNDPDGFPANRNTSFNARTALQAIASNTEGDRSRFFSYPNDKLRTNRVVYTLNLNDGGASLQILFAINSDDLPSNADDLAFDPAFRGDANANLFNLADFSAANFTAAPAPGAAALLGLGGRAAGRRRR